MSGYGNQPYPPPHTTYGQHSTHTPGSQPQPYPTQYHDSQAYPPPPPAYPTGDVHGGPAAPKPPTGKPEDFTGPKQERFVPTGKWQDLWALVLFYFHLGGYIALLVLTVPFINAEGFEKLDFSFAVGLDVTREFISVGISAGVSFVSCLIYLFLLSRYPLPIVKFSFWASIVIFIALAIYQAVVGQFVQTVIFVIVALFFLMTYRTFKARMPLVALLIRTVVEVADAWKGVYAVTIGQSLVGLVHTASVLAIFFGGLIRWYIPPGAGNTPNPQTPNGGSVESVYIAVVLYAVFSLYWTQQVIKNVGHVTLGGVFASFYFLSPPVTGGSSSAAQQGPGMPRFPTLGSLKRAMTTSFGSIAFGSLVIAFLQFIRFLIRQVAYQSDGPLVFFACCVDCILGCIEGLIEFFNEYAFAQVAIYGKPYVRAAKDTWNLLKTRGLDLIVQENLTNAVLLVGSFIVAGLSIAAAFVAAFVQGVNVIGNITSFVLLVLLPLVISMVLFGVIGVVIDSGVATTFVALAEEPDALYRTKPELYDAIRRAFPSITVPVSNYA